MSNLKADWSNPEDFNLEDANWVDITSIADAHEIQMDTHSGEYRHRMRLTGSKWIKGRPNDPQS